MPFPVDNIRKICKEKKTSIKQVEAALGFGNGVIARWEQNSRYPSYDRLSAVADYLGVSISDLTGEEQKENPAPEGAEQIPGYSQLNDANRGIVDTMIAQLLAAQSSD